MPENKVKHFWEANSDLWFHCRKIMQREKDKIHCRLLILNARGEAADFVMKNITPSDTYITMCKKLFLELDKRYKKSNAGSKLTLQQRNFQKFEQKVFMFGSKSQKSELPKISDLDDPTKNKSVVKKISKTPGEPPLTTDEKLQNILKERREERKPKTPYQGQTSCVLPPELPPLPDINTRKELCDFIDRKLNKKHLKTPLSSRKFSERDLAKMCAEDFIHRASRNALSYTGGAENIKLVLRASDAELGIAMEKIDSFTDDSEFDTLIKNMKGEMVNPIDDILRKMVLRFWKRLLSRIHVYRNKIRREYGFDMDSIPGPDERRLAYKEVGYSNPQSPEDLKEEETLPEDSYLNTPCTTQKVKRRFQNGMWLREMPDRPPKGLISQAKELMLQIREVLTNKRVGTDDEIRRLCDKLSDKLKLMNYTVEPPFELIKQGWYLISTVSKKIEPLPIQERPTEWEDELDSDFEDYDSSTEIEEFEPLTKEEIRRVCDKLTKKLKLWENNGDTPSELLKEGWDLINVFNEKLEASIQVAENEGLQQKNSVCEVSTVITEPQTKPYGGVDLTQTRADLLQWRKDQTEWRNRVVEKHQVKSDT